MLDTVTAVVDFYLAPFGVSVVLRPETIEGVTWYTGTIVHRGRVVKFWAHTELGVRVGGRGLVSSDVCEGMKHLACSLFHRPAHGA